MSSFLLALQFFTVLPLKIKNFNEKRAALSVIYFPVVGLFLGLILVFLNTLLLSSGFARLTADVILIVSLIVMTGGMHLDGLSDTADAFVSGKKKEEMLAIMRDPHTGVMGVLSLICVVLLKVGLLFSISAALKPAVLILMCILGRWSAVLQIYLFPYARQEGKAKLFVQGMNLQIFLIAGIITIICASCVLYIGGLIVLLFVSSFAYITARFINSKIDGITGDTLGASIELAEVFTLLIICFGQGVING